MSTPRLSIACPPTPYQAERAWILEVLVGDHLGLPYRVVDSPSPHYRLSLEGGAGGEVVLPDVFFQTRADQWLTPASLPSGPLPSFAVPGGEFLPAIFPGTPDVAWDLPVDVFGSAFYMLTRYEELVLPDRDDHGRFPAKASLAFREGFLELPLVDAYVDALAQILARKWPGLTRRARASALVLSHDVDWPVGTLGLSPLAVARACMGDVLKRRDTHLAARRARAFVQVRGGRFDKDPCNTFDFMMDTSERCGVRSAFYFITDHPFGRTDGTYEVDDPWIIALLRRIAARGHEIGLHPSYTSYDDPHRTRLEFERLRSAARAAGVEQAGWGGRQHYLRWRNPVTWRNWADAGLQYDSTMGFADHVGFRAGTARPYQVFDLASRTVLPLQERPLVAMDVTLQSYMGLSSEDAGRRLQSLSAVCRRYGGDLTLLWHNNSLCSREEKRWYRDIVAVLAA